MHGNRIINTLLPLWSDFFDALHRLTIINEVSAIPRRKDAMPCIDARYFWPFKVESDQSDLNGGIKRMGPFLFDHGTILS